jgi:hypothetical protein
LKREKERTDETAEKIKDQKDPTAKGSTDENRTLFVKEDERRGYKAGIGAPAPSCRLNSALSVDIGTCKAKIQC